MSLKAVIPMATITMFVCLTEGGISRRSNTNIVVYLYRFQPFKTYFPCQFKRQHVKSECCLFDVASNSLPTPRSVVHPSYLATTCN